MRWGRVVAAVALGATLLPWPGLRDRVVARFEAWQQDAVGTWVPVMLAAQTEQRVAGHRRIGSEHLLLALVEVGSGPSARWLREHGCEVHDLRRRVRAAIDQRAGDPQGVGVADLEAVGARGLPLRPGAREPRRFRGRERDYSPEAGAVLETMVEHVQDTNAGLRARRRRLVEDDLAYALAMTRGTRAQDVLRELQVDADALAQVARSARVA